MLVGAGVGAEAGEILDLMLDEGVDELLGDAAEAEAAERDLVSVPDVFGGLELVGLTS